MQIKSLRIKSYRSWTINDTASADAVSRMKKLELYDKLKAEGCHPAICLEAIGWSKATYYRWLKRHVQQGWVGLEARSCCPRTIRTREWTKQHEQAVLHLRQRYRLWGKRKIWKVLHRDHGFKLSISTVGRILKRLMRLKRIRPVAFYYGQIKPKRQRQFKHHAKRWRYGMKAKQPGELTQIDHMSVSFTEGFSLKEFKATCSRLNIPLYVLPPRKPKWNGCVERANGTTRYEFYPFYEGALTIAAVNREIETYQHYYNHYRPHDGIGLETPMSYYQQLIQAA